MPHAAITVKRVYAAPADEDGARFLVDRLWPRGLRKDAVPLDGWLRDAAPSTELRRWFDHDPSKWSEFSRRYRAELAAAIDALAPLTASARRGAVTLLFAGRNETHTHALVLRDHLHELLQHKPAHAL